MKPSYPYSGPTLASPKPKAEPKAEPKTEPIELTPVELAPIESPQIKPHKIGDRFYFLGCGPFTIAAVISGPAVITGAIHEYVAVYVGNKDHMSGQRHWETDRYSHESIRIISNRLKT